MRRECHTPFFLHKRTKKPSVKISRERRPRKRITVWVRCGICRRVGIWRGRRDARSVAFTAGAMFRSWIRSKDAAATFQVHPGWMGIFVIYPPTVGEFRNQKRASRCRNHRQIQHISRYREDVCAETSKIENPHSCRWAELQKRQSDLALF